MSSWPPVYRRFWTNHAISGSVRRVNNSEYRETENKNVARPKCQPPPNVPNWFVSSESENYAYTIILRTYERTFKTVSFEIQYYSAGCRENFTRKSYKCKWLFQRVVYLARTASVEVDWKAFAYVLTYTICTKTFPNAYQLRFVLDDTLSYIIILNRNSESAVSISYEINSSFF